MLQLGATVNLVVCQKSKIEDWIEHLKMYNAYVPEFVYDLTDKNKMNAFMNHASSTDANTEMCYGVINYELTFRRKELMQLHGFTLVCDESGLINNENAKRTKAIMNMDAENVILLSGTICGGKYEKLWSQMKLLGWKISKAMFYNHYVAYHYDDSNGFPLMIIDGYKNEERLKKKMRDYGCHFLKTDEVFDLPEQVHQTISIPTTSEYRKFRKDSIVIFDDPYDVENAYTLVGDTTLTKMLYERQLCGQYNQDKLKAFQDIVESTNDRLIVFYNFNAELDAMQNVLLDIDFEEYSKRTSVVNGKLKALQNYENKSNSITFIQYQAGAMGLNLQKANKIIYFTPPLSSELFEQSKKRIHRIGQQSTCFYYYLTCKGSVEEKIYKTLAMRKDYTEALFEEGAADD